MRMGCGIPGPVATLTRCTGQALQTESCLTAASFVTPNALVRLPFLILDVPVAVLLPLTDDLGLAPPSGVQENEGGYWHTVLGGAEQATPILPPGLPLATPAAGRGSTLGRGGLVPASGSSVGGARGRGLRRSQPVGLRDVDTAWRDAAVGPSDSWPWRWRLSPGAAFF